MRGVPELFCKGGKGSCGVKEPLKGSVMVLMALVGVWSVGKHRAIAQPHPIPAPTVEDPVFLRPPSDCPPDLETLMAGLLRDLPSYANRVASRSLGINEEIAGFGTVLVAGRAEFEPLDVPSLSLSDRRTEAPEAIHQVFFTTLERQYTETTGIELEHYHWLFLTEAADGWRPVLLFSRLAVDDADLRPPTPPRETSTGIIGQAVRLWLRDCRAGAVYPVDGAD